VAFVGARYAGLDAVVGGSGQIVHLQLADSGGIFTNAQVTYRGVAVGRVGPMRLRDDGVEVDLRLDSDAPPVPADVAAVVAYKSAVGEQHFDLRPRVDGGPTLQPGDVIEQQDTRLPPPVETALVSLDQLVQSVPTDDLRVVVDEMYLAMRDNGPHLQTLLDTSAAFTEQAQRHLSQTTALITDAETVLGTQNDLAEGIKQFGADAKLIARQLAESDGDLRAILADGPGLAREMTALMRESGEPLGSLLANLLAVSEVAEARHDSLEDLLVLTPRVVTAGSDVITEEGARFGLVTTFFDPLPCVKGYEGTEYRDGLDTTPLPLNTNAGCSGR
jgi:phospholipid/cholesterol/gamma-HCH transport system substrate-binding protein